jgi:hypothetical protein
MVISQDTSRSNPNSARPNPAGCTSIVDHARRADGCPDFAITATRSTPAASTTSSAGTRKRPSRTSTAATPATRNAQQRSRRRQPRTTSPTCGP